MINGVLVERTVEDVLPALQTNADGLKKVLDDLMKQYQTKQTEMENWKVRAQPLTALVVCGPLLTYLRFAEEEQCSGRPAIEHLSDTPNTTAIDTYP